MHVIVVALLFLLYTIMLIFNTLSESTRRDNNINLNRQIVVAGRIGTTSSYLEALES